MYLLYCDESNLEERNGDFLLYAGLAIPGANAKALSDAILGCLAARGIDRDYKLKFNPGPTNLNHQEFIDLKIAVINAAIAADAKLMLYMVLHDIARDPDEARRNGINTLCYHFDCLLTQINETGLVLIDRFNDAGNAIEAHLTEKLTVGLKGMPFSNEMSLKNILGYHYSAIGQSHFSSLIDVIVGSLRFAVNVKTRNQPHVASARAILEGISPLFYRHSGSTDVPEIGCLLSPKSIKADTYRQQYQSLKSFFADAGITLSQVITQDKGY